MLHSGMVSDEAAPMFHLWSFEEGEAHALAVCRITERQLGRGVDMA